MQGSLGAPGRQASSYKSGLVVVLGAAALGAGVAIAPNYVFATLGALILIFLLSRGPLTRAVIVVSGGLTLLQGSAALSVEKVTYLVVLVLATLFAGHDISSRWREAKSIGALPILVATCAVAAVVALSYLVSRRNGIAIESWAADVPAYGMLIVAVVLGLDLALSNHAPRDIVFPFLLVCLIAAVGYAIYWTQRRGVTELDLSRLVLASQFLPAAGFCLSLAYVFDGRRTYRMAIFVTLLVLTMLASGTRILILFAVPVVVTLAVAYGHRRLRILSLMLVAGITVALVVGIVSNTAAAGYLNVAVLQARLAGIIPLLTSQDASADGSLYLRYLQTLALQHAWALQPWFGIGPGAVYSYANIVNSHPVDSPIAIFARFGLIGAAVIAVLFATLFASRLRSGAHWVPATALLSFVSLIVAWSFASSPLDDKGVALGLIPLMGLCGVWRKASEVAAGSRPA